MITQKKNIQEQNMRWRPTPPTTEFITVKKNLSKYFLIKLQEILFLKEAARNK